MPDLPQILVYGTLGDRMAPVVEGLAPHCRLILANTVTEAIDRLARDPVQGVCVLGDSISPTGFLLEARGLLQQIPDGLALLDSTSRILWHNQQLAFQIESADSLVGFPFFSIFESTEILGPDFGPLHTALASGETARTLMRVGELTYFELAATPIVEDEDEFPSHLLVTVRDVSRETIEQQKLDAIYRAGLELGDLLPQDVLDMSIEDRIELLKSKILFFTQDVLEFETVEIRLVERDTLHLRPLLSVGMDALAEGRELFAKPEGNGVTGFVAATGRSYLCEDIEKDPLYLPGAPGARSSLTVPLILHDDVLGTFNVESPRPGAFSQADLQFLELFAREIAIALNTLNLLAVEEATSITESSLQLLRDVASPIDGILNDAAWIRDKFGGQDDGVQERIERILGRTREIRSLIHQVGDAMTSRLQQAGLSQSLEGCQLHSKRILVADADPDVRRSAHELLGRYGCIVETAHDGGEALLMARTFYYDVVIADIRLPDMNGADCYRLFREHHPETPVILMTGFGYDSGHSLVKARQMGMKMVLYKPFRRDLLLRAVEDAILPV